MELRRGNIVKLIEQEPSHTTGKRHVQIGTEGIILATRQKPGDDERKLLVKFMNHATPRHTSISSIERVRS